MNMINIDARHILVKAQKERQSKNMKKFVVLTAAISATLIVATLVVQHLCVLNPYYCM